MKPQRIEKNLRDGLEEFKVNKKKECCTPNNLKKRSNLRHYALIQN